MDLQSIKNRFGIIGNSPVLNYALNVATQVSNTDLSVLINGESGVGKEVFSQIIHALSSRKHNPFIAVNCGAIPEGTIDSELFGHEKGSFTGAMDSRKGYFETVNGGTIFLDEIGELPLGTQARLLRVLETGEYIRVGSSKVQKTDVRVIAATNKELLESTQSGKFREDLYYRLNTVPIRVPSLRDRKEDIALLFRKFASDFSDRYKGAPIQLDEEAKSLLMTYPWPGNVREILYTLFFDMKKDVNELKKMFFEILQNPGMAQNIPMYNNNMDNMMPDNKATVSNNNFNQSNQAVFINPNGEEIYHHEAIEESLSIMDKEKELIIKALKKHKGKRKDASSDLGISERTLYRKLKEYDIED